MSGVSRDTLHGASSAFTLHCRGEVRLYCGDAECTPKSKKARALLAVLAAEQRPLARVRIIDLLWSDRQEEQARASLRTLLADLKQQFDSRFDDLLVVDRERVGLAPGVRTDLADPVLARPAGELFEGLDHIDPELDEWLRVEREKWAKTRTGAVAAAAPGSPGEHAARVKTIPRWALAAALLLALAAAALLYFRPWAPPEQAVVAVLKFKDLTGKNALLAEGVAEELRIQLAERDNIRVIGSLSSDAVTSGAGAAASARRKLNASHVIEGTLLPGNPHRLSIRLVETDEGRTMWNHVAAADPAIVTSGDRPLGRMIAEQVSDTVEPPGPAEAFIADSASHQKLFRARQLLRYLDSPDAPEARRLMLEVVSRHPRFVPALAALAEATFRSSNHPFYRGPIPLVQARREAEAYALRAVRIAPDYGPGYLALGYARLDTPGALAPLRRAVELSPGSYRARYRLARALETTGDIEGAIAHQRVAIQLEPLDPSGVGMLIQYLAYADRREEMERVFTDFVARSDDRNAELELDLALAMFVDDYSRAVRAAFGRLAHTPRDEQVRRGVFWSLSGLEAWSLAATYAQPGSMSQLLLRNDTAGVIAKVRALGPDFWMMNFETLGAAEHLVATGHGKVLVDAYDRASGRLSEDLMGSAALIVALRADGRTAEAEKLLARRAEWVARTSRGLPAHMRAGVLAEQFALAGRNEQAVRALEIAQKGQPTLLLGFYRMRYLGFAAFAGLRGHPRLRALEKDYLAFMNRERREAAADLRRMGRVAEARELERPLIS